MAATAAAALAGLAYLNARWRVSVDLSFARAVFKATSNFSKREKAGRTNSFYLIEEHAQNPSIKDKTFIIYQGRAWTFAQTYDKVLQYAGYLHSQHGLQAGETVALDFMNSPQFLFLVLAIWSLGALPAFINYNLTSTALVHSVRVSKTRLLIVDPEVEPTALTEETRSALQAPDFSDDSSSALEIAVWTDALEASLEDSPPFRAPNAVRSGAIARSTCVLIFTSGTTGLPKAAIVPWDRTVVGADMMGRWIGLRPVTSANPDRYYTAMPLYHGSAFQLAFHTCLSCPATLVLSRKFSVSNFWDEVAAADATVIQYVGETLRYLLAAPPQPDDSTKHHVRLAMGNGLRPDVWDRFRDRFGVETIAEFYGATEAVAASWNLSRNTFASGAIGSFGILGELVLATTTQSIVEIDWEREAPRRDPKTGFCIKSPRGEPGELLYAVDPKDIGAKYHGYFGNKSASDSKICRDVHKKGDAWFRSGDVVRFDKERRLWFSDRMGDTFRWRSENVSTAEVAQVLGRHPAVLEACVYGVEIPSHDGRAGCAAVLLKDVTTSDTQIPQSVLQSIAAFARSGLPKYAVPVFLRVVTEIASTGNNKQQKQVLRAEGVNPGNVGAGDRMFYLKSASDRFEVFGTREWDAIEGGRVKL